MLASVPSATVLGVRGAPVVVEVHVGPGLPSFQMVGLPDESCRESRDRVRAAIVSSGLSWPDRRITINLAPSQHRKTGSSLDLAIAVGILVAGGQLPPRAVATTAFVGELGLDGSLRSVPGVAPMVAAIDAAEIVVPSGCVGEAAACAEGRVRTVTDLRELAAVVDGRAAWRDPPPVAPEHDPYDALGDLADVRGQPVARRALELAAAGGHHLVLVGPPGAGKTMLARRLPGLLPPLDRADAVTATMIHSAAGFGSSMPGLVRRPPFRAPHHTTSSVALIGGGSHGVRPGEVSLAHGGVLFLDELGEFPATVLDALRQPLESGEVHVARATDRVTMPARFLLVAASNPCPCGGGAPGSCRCDEPRRQRYLRRLSGPLLDRFDLRVTVDRPEPAALLGGGSVERTATVAGRVAEARRAMVERQGAPNAALPAERLDEVAPLTPAARALVLGELEAGRLSGRGLHRVRRVARTVADLAGSVSGPVDDGEIAEALALRARLATLAGAGVAA